jgi:hypothetical protein
VAHSLYRSAIGYSHPAVKFVVVNNEVQELHYVEHYPPNPTAMIFWLKNRQPGLWRDHRRDDDGQQGNNQAPGSVTKLESRVIDAEFRDITDAVLDAAGVAAAARRNPAPGDAPGLPTVVTTSPL